MNFFIWACGFSVGIGMGAHLSNVEGPAGVHAPIVFLVMALVFGFAAVATGRESR